MRLYSTADFERFKGVYRRKVLRAVKELRITRKKGTVDGHVQYVYTQGEFDRIMGQMGFKKLGSEWVRPAKRQNTN